MRTLLRIARPAALCAVVMSLLTAPVMALPAGTSLPTTALAVGAASDVVTVQRGNRGGRGFGMRGGQRNFGLRGGGPRNFGVNRGYGRYGYRGNRGNFGRNAGIGLGAAIIGGVILSEAARAEHRSSHSDDWERCEQTYKSFESSTGMYTGYDGIRRTCPYLN